MPCWINLTFIRKSSTKEGFAFFRIFTFCSKLSNLLNRYIKKSITNFIVSSLISDSYVIHRGSISYQTDPPPPYPLPLPLPLPSPPLPSRVLCTVLVTIPWAGPHSHIKFHLIDNESIRPCPVDRHWNVQPATVTLIRQIRYRKQSSTT